MLIKVDSVRMTINNFKIVRIPAFNLSFISYQEGNTLQFIPLKSDLQRNIVQGRPVAAEKILESYVQAANEYNGLPL